MKRTARILATMAVAVSLTVGAASAESDKCIRELPIKRTEHWMYRIVNGQRCWFPDSERATVAINAKRKVQAPAPRSPNTKVGLPRPPSAAAENELQTPDAFADVWNDRVTSSSRISLPRTASGAVENKSQAFAAVAEVWKDHVAPRDLFGRVPVATSKFEHPAPIEAGLPRSLLAYQQSASPPTASTTNDVGIMLWFGIGIGVLGMSLFGRTAWKILRLSCNLVRNKHLARKRQSLATVDIPN